MTKKLINLTAIDLDIAHQHKQWVKKYYQQNKKVNDAFDLESLYALDFGFANHPHLWPSNRVGKTPLAESNTQSPVDFIHTKIRYYRWRKKLLRLFNVDTTDIDQFEKDYQKIIKLLKEKFLIEALKHSIQSAIELAKNYLDLNELNQLNNISPLYLQYREDWLAKHYDISVICQQVTNKLKGEIKNVTHQLMHQRHQKNVDAHICKIMAEDLKRYHEISQLIQQSEILAKRYIDIYYNKDKKITNNEFIRQSISSVTLSIGFWSCLGAIALTIAGFFVPVLWIPAGILGYISFISCVKTGFLVYKMVNEGKNKRSPDSYELRDTIIEAVLLPFYTFGSDIVVGIGKASISLSHASANIANSVKQVFAIIAIAWDGIFSNVGSLADAKETFFGIKQVMLGYDPLKNTKSATSWAYVKRKLAQEHTIEAATDIVKQNKILATKLAEQVAEEIKKETGDASIYQFTYTLFVPNLQPNKMVVKQFKSYHQAILSWKVKSKLID